MASPPVELAQQSPAAAASLARYLPKQSEEFLGPVLDLPALVSDNDDHDCDYTMDGADGTHFTTYEEPDFDRETGDLGGDLIL